MEHLLGPSEPGGVVLDIGGDIGAAALQTPASLLGSEIEIRRQGDAWEGIHTAVRERQLPDGPVYAALFGALTGGRYDVRVRGGDRAGPVGVIDVEGGKVTQAVFDPGPEG